MEKCNRLYFLLIDKNIHLLYQYLWLWTNAYSKKFVVDLEEIYILNEISSTQTSQF